jgi:formylglycine-generating enzyme required for sulfatase activity
MKTIYETKDGKQFTTKREAVRHEKSLKVTKHYPMKFIKIDKGYEMQVTPITQKQWEYIMHTNPSYFQNAPYNPVETVSYNDVQEFLKKLNIKDKKYTYRLPTEQEWEYCASSCIDGYGWSYENSEDCTQPVAKLNANKLGLHDMLGNVWEWTSSLYDKSGSSRVVRGGSWSDGARSLRSAYRNGVSLGIRYYFLGFRLVRTKR